MSLTVSIHLVVADGNFFGGFLDRTLDGAGIRPMDRRGASITPRRDAPKTAEIRVTVIADDEQAVTAAIVDACIQQGVKVLSSNSKATPVEPKELNSKGVDYDMATGTLTVETWGPDWGDLSIKLLRTEDSITGLMVSSTSGRVEDGLAGIFHIIIRRPGGNFNEA